MYRLTLSMYIYMYVCTHRIFSLNARVKFVFNHFVQAHDFVVIIINTQIRQFLNVFMLISCAGNLKFDSSWRTVKIFVV